MRRADRLFQIVQILRSRRITTAASLAEQLEVSERTIYRDVRDLVLSGIPIEGAAGIGYALPRRFELPPLMFTAEELQALALGAQIVEGWADPALSRAAASVLVKVENVLPESLKDRLSDTTLNVPGGHIPEPMRSNLELLRTAIDGQRKIRLDYRRLDGEYTSRTVRPLGLFYWGVKWTLTGWCELRDDFRSFRVDHIEKLQSLDARFEPAPGQTLEDYLARRNGNS